MLRRVFHRETQLVLYQFQHLIATESIWRRKYQIHFFHVIPYQLHLFYVKNRRWFVPITYLAYSNSQLVHKTECNIHPKFSEYN